MKEFTLSSKSEGNYYEKGSTFSAIAIPILSVVDIKKEISQLKEQYPDASHICYGYRIKNKNQLDEFSTDAGEPNASAGQSILNVLKRNQLVDTVIFVIRYFGGTKLGIPGLIRAYGMAAELALEKAVINKWVLLERISFSYNYDLQKKVDAILQKFEVNIINTDFSESIQVNLEIEVKKTKDLGQQLIEISNGAIKV